MLAMHTWFGWQGFRFGRGRGGGRRGRGGSRFGVVVEASCTFGR